MIQKEDNISAACWV